jgi:hypothetical protein
MGKMMGTLIGAVRRVYPLRGPRWCCAQPLQSPASGSPSPPPEMSTPTVTRYTFFSVYYGGKLSVESMFNFLVEEKYPNAHFFVDEVPFEWIS